MKNEASKRCKEFGLSSLAELSKYTNVCRQTLSKWNVNKPVLFDIVCIGVQTIKHKEMVDKIKSP